MATETPTIVRFTKGLPTLARMVTTSEGTYVEEFGLPETNNVVNFTSTIAARAWLSAHGYDELPGE